MCHERLAGVSGDASLHEVGVVGVPDGVEALVGTPTARPAVVSRGLDPRLHEEIVQLLRDLGLSVFSFVKPCEFRHDVFTAVFGGAFQERCERVMDVAVEVAPPFVGGVAYGSVVGVEIAPFYQYAVSKPLARIVAQVYKEPEFPLRSPDKGTEFLDCERGPPVDGVFAFERDALYPLHRVLVIAEGILDADASDGVRLYDPPDERQAVEVSVEGGPEDGLADLALGELPGLFELLREQRGAAVGLVWRFEELTGFENPLHFDVCHPIEKIAPVLFGDRVGYFAHLLDFRMGVSEPVHEAEVPLLVVPHRGGVLLSHLVLLLEDVPAVHERKTLLGTVHDCEVVCGRLDPGFDVLERLDLRFRLERGHELLQLRLRLLAVGGPGRPSVGRPVDRPFRVPHASVPIERSRAFASG